MSIGDETRLRAQLGAALDEFDPSPLALDTVLRRGTATVIRRRVLAAVAVVLIAVAAVTSPRLVHQLGHQTPSAPLHYQVTVVKPPDTAANKQVVAFGRLNNLHWTAEVSYKGGYTDQCFHIRGISDESCNGTGGWPTFPTEPTDSFIPQGSGPLVVIISAVRADVSYLVVSLGNGQTETLRPVAVLGRAHPRYVAIVVPTLTSITEVSAYSARGEIKYAVPYGSSKLPALSQFNQNATGTFQIVRWLRPGQPPLPRPATYKIGHGAIGGASWSEYVAVGPWGTCVSNPTGGPFCFPVDVSGLTAGKAAKTLCTANISGEGLSWATIVAEPSVSYIVPTGPHGVPIRQHGHIVRIGLYSVGAAKFATVVSTGRNGITGWIAYSAAGTVLASGAIN